EGICYCLEDKRHERQFGPGAFLERVFVLIAQSRDPRHVNLINCRYMRRGAAGHYHVLRDLLPHHPHLLDAIPGRRALRDRRRQLWLCWWLLWSAGGSGSSRTRLNETQDVVLGDSAAETCTFKVVDIDAVFFSNVAYQRARFCPP